MADLALGQERSFANHPEIPQFSKYDAGTGDIRGAGSLRILLPYPDQIIPLRCGSLADFESVTKPGAVRDSILRSCQGGNDQFALATCLRFARNNSFFGPTTSTYSFYAEHDHEPSSNEVTTAYHDSRQIFASGRFDLELNGNDPQNTQIGPDENPGYGILPEEEYSLAELIHVPVTGQRGINVANCVQFGINP